MKNFMFLLFITIFYSHILLPFKELLNALKKDDHKKVAKLIHSKININNRSVGDDQLDQTPLHYAAKYNAIKCIPLIIDAGADIHSADNNGNTPLHLAANNFAIEALKLLIQNNANINIQNKQGWSPLHFAVCVNSLEACKLLIDAKANLNLIGYEGNTNQKGRTFNPLHLAIIQLFHNKQPADTGFVARSNLIEIIKLLINAHIDLEWSNNEYLTPLHHVILYSEPSIFFNDKKWYLLMSANYQNSITVATLLIQAQANVNSNDHQKNTPLHYAISQKSYEITLLLLQAGAHVNIKNNYGNTPLHFAVSNNLQEITQLLLKFGADIHIKCDKCYTALDYCQTKEMYDLINTWNNKSKTD